MKINDIIAAIVVSIMPFALLAISLRIPLPLMLSRGWLALLAANGVVTTIVFQLNARYLHDRVLFVRNQPLHLAVAALLDFIFPLAPVSKHYLDLVASRAPQDGRSRR
jgi:predicted Abi (CAAX) family protease